jgi:hypothetical protein
MRLCASEVDNQKFTSIDARRRVIPASAAATGSTVTRSDDDRVTILYTRQAGHIAITASGESYSLC